ncbi:uncharacterized protein L3040_000520 [Drepanopeziza brunnea f. sp. 'multigermtubi']|uniref:uncharacterized protein n=1 Tax=Drepanopeziza brunnea f. sp. 'multigermtubi' TaxID=698441 RepID=UPI0023963660|nr:hypothetical protein L3040_000520 [Drepanopeziza brunnea f. sp. 'multigermtubi']
MIYLILVATAAVASAQVTFDPVTNKFVCPADKLNGAFCAGDSLGTNIIIRCTDGVGQPGNCNDNLAGFFPFGVRSSLCWQSSATSGIAACSKNCIVQGGSGTFNGTLTLPDCIPISQSSSSVESTTVSTYVPSSQSSNVSTTTSTYVQPSSTPESSTTLTYINPGPSTSLSSNITSTYVNPGHSTVTITSTGTVTTTCVTDGTTTTSTVVFTTTYCPDSSPVLPPSLPTGLTSTYVQPSGTPGTVSPSGSPVPSGNGTLPTTVPASGSGSGSATATPVGPTASPSSTGPVLSNDAIGHFRTPGAGLATLCLFVVYFL